MSIWLSLMLLLAQVCSFPRHQLHLVVQMCWCCFPAEVPTAILMDVRHPSHHVFSHKRTRNINCTPGRKLDTWGVSEDCGPPHTYVWCQRASYFIIATSTFWLFIPELSYCPSSICLQMEQQQSWRSDPGLTLMSASTLADSEHSKRGLLKHAIIPEEKHLFHPKV